MKAAIIRKYGTIALEEVEKPGLPDNNVLIKLRYASICGSDQHIFKGEFHPRTQLPLIPGHEFAGVVEAVGKEVKNFHPGEKVTVDPILWCGKCAACKVGQAILHAASTITKGKIILADILDDRLSIASSTFPNLVVVNTALRDPVALIKELTNGCGVDVAFEAVGHDVKVEGRLNPVRTCINAIKGGGTVCVLGLGDHPAEILMKELIWKEAKIISSRVSHGEFSRTIEALDKKTINPQNMITGILKLENAQQGFELLESEPGKHLKILLKIDD